MDSQTLTLVSSTRAESEEHGSVVSSEDSLDHAISMSSTISKVRRMPNGQSTRGKRIHYCGMKTPTGGTCKKIFTRREHLRRHQLKHAEQDADDKRRDLSNEHDEIDERLQALQSNGVLSGNPSPKSTAPNRAAKEIYRLSVPQAPSYPLGHRNAPEVELVQYYTQNADKLFLDPRYMCQHNYKYWLDRVPQVVETGGKMLDAVLSMSCAHLSLLRPHQSKHYLHLATQYHVRALASQRRDMQALTSEDPGLSTERLEAMLFVGVHLPMRTFFNIQYDSLSPVPDQQLYDDILYWLFVCQEVPNLLNIVMPFAKNTSFFQNIVLNHQHPPKKIAHARECSDLRLWPIAYFGDIIEFAKEDPAITDEALDVCRSTLGWIEYAFYTLRQPRFHKSLLQCRVTIACAARPEFLALLRIKNPLAIAVWGRFLALEKQPDVPWWCAIGNLERKMECMGSFLPDHWLWAMDLPMRIARGEISLVEVAQSTRRGPGADRAAETHQHAPQEPWCSVGLVGRYGKDDTFFASHQDLIIGP